MTKTYYSDYVRHMLRLWFEMAYETKTDKANKLNEIACAEALRGFSAQDKLILSNIYTMRGNFATNVNSVAKNFCLPQGKVWRLVEDVEIELAIARGLK